MMRTKPDLTVGWLVVLVLTLCSCDRDDQKSDGPQPTTSTNSKPVVNTDITVKQLDLSDQSDSEGVSSVYPTGVVADSRATQLCNALWKAPRERRAECCAQKPSGLRPEALCVNALSTALADGAVELNSAAVVRCAAARSAALDGCEWVGNLRPPTPHACLGLLGGTRASGASCRATTECVAGLRCAGSGPTDTGTCASPAAAGVSCNTGVDALAAAALQPGRTDDECAGYCATNLCRDLIAPGGECNTSLECGTGAHCDGKVCRKGLAANGKPCAGGGCEPGEQCLQSACARPSLSGACRNDLDCIGACVDGQCGKRCQRVIAK